MLKLQIRFPFALSLSQAKLFRRNNGCTFLLGRCSKKKDRASTSSARAGFGVLLAFQAGIVAGCAEKWPEDGRAWIEDRLAKGPSAFDCYHSFWNEDAGITFPSPSVLQGQQCSPASSETLWFASADAVNAVTRCQAAGYVFEYSVTAFSADHYYDGHYCNYAAAPVGTDLPPLGEMTQRGTAMDGDFRPYPKTPRPPARRF